jgi:hypothetical protein
MTHASKPRSFCPTPDRLVLGLLIVEGLLWLSSKLFWLPKAWPIVAAMAVVSVAILAMALWLVAALVFHWQFQFGIRSLFVLTFAIASLFGWLAAAERQAKRQTLMVVKVEALGGGVVYDWIYIQGMRPHGAPREPRWARRLLGDDFFHRVTAVAFVGTGLNDDGLARLCNTEGVETVGILCLPNTKITGAGLKGLRRWSGLDYLDLRDTAITDASVEDIKALVALGALDLSGTKVTADGVRKLQEALPKCHINHWRGKGDKSN